MRFKPGTATNHSPRPAMRQLMSMACWVTAVGIGTAAAESGGILQIRDGYFWDPATRSTFIARGPAYQSWNPPVFANQSFDQLAYDMRQFAKLRANSVRAEFVWGETEIADDVYDWERADFLVRTAEELGLKLFVLIGFQYPPGWFPEEQRAINDRGTRSDVLNYESVEAQNVYSEHMATVVARYKDSPAIGGWIIGNEFAYFDLWENLNLYPARRLLGFDPTSLAAYRDWLKTSYAGDLSALNANWSTSYTSFDEAEMAPAYPEDSNDEPSYHDLIQWRKQSIANFLALGAKAVKDSDPNHLISYSMVGGILTGRDANNTCEDPETIVKTCADIGAPLDFWSVNNYAWASEGAELRSLDFGIAKYQDRTGLPVMLSETGHTSSETANDEASRRQAQALRSSLWEPLSSGGIGIHFFHWNDRNQFNDTPFEREAGFGIVHQNRKSKGAVYENVEGLLRRMEEIDVDDLLSGSRNPNPEILFYLSATSDVGFPRANQEQTMLAGALKRLGYQVGIIGPQDFFNNAFGTAQALAFPRCEQLEPEVLGHVLSNVLPSGIHVHSDTDLSGQYNAYRQPNPGWATQFQSIFGLDVRDAVAAWDGGVTQEWGRTYAQTTLTGTTGFGSLPAGYDAGILSWKIWHDVEPVTGTTILEHSGLDNSAPGSPALQFLHHAGAKAAASTLALGDVHSLLSGAHAWDLRYEVLGAIYRDYFGIEPRIRLTGTKAQYVVPDYRICRNGSILVSLLNGHISPVSFTLSSPTLLAGKTVEHLSEGGILETQSDGSVDLTIPGDGYILLYAYDETGSGGSLIDPSPYRIWFESAPQSVWPSIDEFAVEMGYDTRGEPLGLSVVLESKISPRNTYASSEAAVVTGNGKSSRSLALLDADHNAPAYRSTPDGGSYQLRASLHQDGVPVAEVSIPIRLTWGVRPLSLPAEVVPGASYAIEVEWEELPGYFPDEGHNTIRRTDLFESDAVLSQHYNIVLELRDGAGEVVGSDLRVTRAATGLDPFRIDVPSGAVGPFSWYAYSQTADGASTDVIQSFEGWDAGAAFPFNPLTEEIGPTAADKADYTGLLAAPVTKKTAIVTAQVDGVDRSLRDELGDGTLAGTAGDTGSVDYETGEISITLNPPPTAAGGTITVDYNAGRAKPQIIDPWVLFTFAPPEYDLGRLYLNHGVHIEGSHGSQSVFLVVANPPDVGDFSGFGLIHILDAPIAIPPAQLTQYHLSFAFREKEQYMCDLELQLKDAQDPPGVIQFKKAYEPDADGWDTISATLDQLALAPFSENPVFDYSQVKEIVCAISMGEKEPVLVDGEEQDRVYVGSIDDIRLDGPEQIVLGGAIDAIFDSRNDSLPDTDGDGIADVHETGTGTFNSSTDTGTSPTKPDSDGDGQGDGAEVVAGTDPNDRLDRFEVQISPDDSGDLLISWFARAGRRYEIEFSDGDDEVERLNYLPMPGFGPLEFAADELVSVAVARPPDVPVRLFRVAVWRGGAASP